MGNGNWGTRGNRGERHGAPETGRFLSPAKAGRLSQIGAASAIFVVMFVIPVEPQRRG